MNAKPLVFILFFLTISVTSAYSNVIYVSQSATGNGSGSSWENACTTITAGLTASTSGDEIWVKSATYPEAIVMKEGVALYGGFPVDGSPSFEQRDWRANETIIDASRWNTHVVVAADGATIDGLTITGGLAEKGGGVYCEGASLSLANCTITRNRAEIPGYQSGAGGAVYCLDGQMTLRDCTIEDNSAEAVPGIFFKRSLLNMVNCKVLDNSYTPGDWWPDRGGGLGCRETPVTLTDCVFAGNITSSGGNGADFVQDCTAMLTRCTFASNGSPNSGVGGLAFENTSVTLTSCVIVNNVGYDFGGAVFTTGEYDIEIPCERVGAEGVDCSSMYPTTLTNCLVAGNRAMHFPYYIGGGLAFRDIAPTLTNCTIADNTQPGLKISMRFYEAGYRVFCGCNNVPILNNCIVCDSIDLPSYLGSGDYPIEPDERLEMSNSCLKYEIPESGYIISDPLFVDSANGDYRLQRGSPCIDSGSNELALAIPLDLDGNARIMDGDYSGVPTVDMGAYEFQPPPPRVGSLWILHGEGNIDILSAPTPTP